MSIEITKWLEQLGLGKYAKLFIDNEVDLDAARDLTEDDLKDLGIPLGHRKKILRAVGQFPDASVKPGKVPAQTTDQAYSASPASDAERRHMTVMFCDVVNSTDYATGLDPEDMHALLRQFQNTSGEIAIEYGGFVANQLGDGTLIYFGFPKANEDDAERAIRAALAIAKAVRQLTTPTGKNLEARIGIATGIVVVGEMTSGQSGDPSAVSGSIPHLAARLQGTATAGTVVISESTRRLVGNLFYLKELQPTTLKGFAETVSSWEVRSTRDVESRYAAMRVGQHAKLVGRDSELGVLRDRWESALEGDGQTVLISGEAGIGKPLSRRRQRRSPRT